MAILRIENGLIMDEAVGGIPIERRIVEPGTEAHCVRTLAGLSGACRGDGAQHGQCDADGGCAGARELSAECGE